MVLTCALVLFADLVTAVVVGLVVAALAGARRVESLEVATLVSVPLLDQAVLENLGIPTPIRSGRIRVWWSFPTG